MKRKRPAPGVEARLLKSDDLDRLVELIANHAEYERADFDPTGKAERLGKLLLGHERRATCFVADLDKTLVVGYATVSREFSTWDAGEYLHMDTLFVDAAYRGHRIGECLMNAIKDEAARVGAVNLQWQTPDWNRGAIRFYERHGATGIPKVRFTQAVPRPMNRVCTNADTLNRFTSAWADRDLEGLAACLDAHCRYSPSVGSQPGESHVGIDAVLAGIQKIWQYDDGCTAKFGETTETADTILRTWTYEFEDRPTEHGIDVFRFRDRLIIHKDAYRKST